MGSKERFKSIFYIMAPLVVAFTIQLVTAGLGNVMLIFGMQYSTYLSVVTLFSELAMVVCGYIWYRRLRKEDVFSKSIRPLTVVTAIVFGAGMQGVVDVLLAAILYLGPAAWKADYESLMETMLDTESPWMTVSVVLLAPLAEELFFRGVTLYYGRKYFPVWAAVIAQAVCFGILHINPVQLTYATVMGVIFGLVAVEFGSVWPGVIVHVAVNGSAEILSRIGVELSLPVMGIVGAVLSALAVTVHFVAKRKNI